MGSDWTELPLEEAMDAIIDYRGKTPRKTESGIPLITAKIVKNGRINPTQEYIAEADYDSWMKRGIPQKGDIVLTTEAPLGEVAQLNGDKIALAQRIITLRGKSGLLESDFLKYLLQSNDVQHQLDGRASGTTVSGIKQSELRQIILRFPPLPEQKAIAHILGSLDEKIELNRRMNATLEGMAQALFKSWFVDFDPVIDNAILAGNSIPEEFAERAEVRRAILDKKQNAELRMLNPETEKSSLHNPSFITHYSLFPAAFQLSEEMGWIPEGWEVVPMPEVTTFREGPGILVKDFHEQGVPLIRLAGLKSGVSLLDGCNFLDPIKVEKKWAQFRLFKGDILLSSSASLGRVAEVDDEAIGTIPYTGIIGFRPIEGKTLQRYIHHFLTSSHFQDQVVMMGAGSVLNHFGPTHLKKMNMLIPPLAIQKAFSDFVDPKNRAQYQRLKQSDILTKLRDALLPRFISGELRVPHAEQMIKDEL